MQRFEVSGAVRLIYKSLGVKRLMYYPRWLTPCYSPLLKSDTLITELVRDRFQSKA